MTMLDTKPDRGTPERRPGELTIRELARFGWRQLTSMRTALILLLLLALTAVPGSVIPQERSDSLASTRWQDAHQTLTPIYQKLGLFHVYTSVWFSAVYLLLMISLVGCILPRTFVYLRAIRTPPPPAPRNLARLPDHTTYTTSQDTDEVLDRARVVLRKKGYRLRAGVAGDDAVSGERGYLREVGNLVFHLSILLVLVGFALGSLFGYRGGRLLVVGDTFSNNLTQYDDFEPGSLFGTSQMEDFDFTVNKFDVDWIQSGRGQGMARGFNAHLDYQTSREAPEKAYDLRVNHPLSIGNTDVFLIGHGYAPIITITDGEGNVTFTGPTPFLPQGPDFFSVGVVKAPFAKPDQIGLEGFFYPTYLKVNGVDSNLMGEANNPAISMRVWSGDLGLKDGVSQSIYLLDKAKATPVMGTDGKQLSFDLQEGQTYVLPNGMGTVSFDGVKQWNRVQISQTPGTKLALTGVVLALIGLLGSLFIRPRRIWVRVRRSGPSDGSGDGDEGSTVVELAALDRSGGGEVTDVLSEVVAAMRSGSSDPADSPTEPPADLKEKS